MLQGLECWPADPWKKTNVKNNTLYDFKTYGQGLIPQRFIQNTLFCRTLIPYYYWTPSEWTTKQWACMGWEKRFPKDPFISVNWFCWEILNRLFFFSAQIGKQLQACTAINKHLQSCLTLFMGCPLPFSLPVFHPPPVNELTGGSRLHWNIMHHALQKISEHIPRFVWVRVIYF